MGGGAKIKTKLKKSTGSSCSSLANNNKQNGGCSGVDQADLDDVTTSPDSDGGSKTPTNASSKIKVRQCRRFFSSIFPRSIFFRRRPLDICLVQGFCFIHSEAIFEKEAQRMV